MLPSFVNTAARVLALGALLVPAVQADFDDGLEWISTNKSLPKVVCVPQYPLSIRLN